VPITILHSCITPLLTPLHPLSSTKKKEQRKLQIRYNLLFFLSNHTRLPCFSLHFSQGGDSCSLSLVRSRRPTRGNTLETNSHEMPDRKTFATCLPHLVSASAQVAHRQWIMKGKEPLLLGFLWCVCPCS